MMRLDYRKTLVLGLGFFSISIVWSMLTQLQMAFAGPDMAS